ncbi:MAG TPA: glycoside hydrolase family 9 protein, partial [Abditibacteriaceae bacterium]|nr:glycoside hydrolase family 9 protein [Abditibacteriaceae bacterium]
YVVSVEGIGCSYPFEIAPDIYRAPSSTVLRAFYHQRCHTALEAKYTDHPRAICHTGEQSKFLQTTLRAMDKQYHDGKQNDKVETTGEKRTVTFGWHDAGDWDHEAWHTEAVETLLLAYQVAPQKWRDGESRIPESGNGIPDILDEAIWGANLYKQLQRPDGGTSAGTFADWSPRDGETSTTDTMTYYVYAPDPQASMRWAAIGAQLGSLLPRFGKQKLAKEYLKSAVAAYDWANKNMRDGDEAKVRDDRCQAAAALFQTTGDNKYLQAFKKDFRIKIGDPLMIWEQFDLRWAAWLYAFCDRPNRDVALQKTIVTLCRNYADAEYIDTAAKRAFRKGYNWWRGLDWGTGSNPEGVTLMVAHALSQEPKYLRALSNNCDVTLGGNPLNMTWITGLGARSPREILRIEDWYAPWTKPDAPMNPVAGILIFGPHYFTGDPDPKNPGGVWDIKFSQATAYPHAARWPGYELYFENRFSAVQTEFTVGELATSVASLGYLRADAPAAALRSNAMLR